MIYKLFSVYTMNEITSMGNADSKCYQPLSCLLRYALYSMCHQRDIGLPHIVSDGKSKAKWRLR